MKYLVEIKEDKSVLYREKQEVTEKLILLNDKSHAVGKLSMAFIMALLVISFLFVLV